jgi:HPt (histidine-containing phosphotransfer) domain-containing protein
LPGFDLPAGLARLMGNKRLYRKLLVDFGADYHRVANEIREALGAGDFKQAHSLVHNLKGMAGNLAAGELQTAAEAMEKLVKGGQPDPSSNEQLDHQLIVLEKAVNQALEAVQILGPPVEEKSIEPTTEWSAEITAERVKEITDRINAAAEMGDVIQIKSIAEELMSESDAMAPFCDKLIRLADDFDFDGIQKTLMDLTG